MPETKCKLQDLIYKYGSTLIAFVGAEVSCPIFDVSPWFTFLLTGQLHSAVRRDHFTHLVPGQQQQPWGGNVGTCKGTWTLNWTHSQISASYPSFMVLYVIWLPGQPQQPWGNHGNWFTEQYEKILYFSHFFPKNTTNQCAYQEFNHDYIQLDIRFDP